MRITFVLPTVNMSGGIKVVAIYAKWLATRGHRVVLVSPPPQAMPLKQKLKALAKGEGWTSEDAQPASHVDDPEFDHRVLDRWRPVIDADVPDADVVIATWWETAEWVQALHPSKGAKVYFIQHHEIVFSHLPVGRIRATYRLPMHKIVVAGWIRDVMCDTYGDDTVDLVPNSVDSAQFFAPVRSKQAVPTGGFLYAPVEFKGLDVSLEAMRMLAERIPNLRLICFGSHRPTPELPLPSNAEFTFCPAQDRIKDLYAQCDFWITASRCEGFNLPAMEAMACRTPVVSTRTGWPLEAIQNRRNGVLCDVDAVADLARGAEWILSLPDDEWKDLSQQAFHTARAGSWEESSLKFEAALTRASWRSSIGEIAGPCTATYGSASA